MRLLRHGAQIRTGEGLQLAATQRFHRFGSCQPGGRMDLHACPLKCPECLRPAVIRDNRVGTELCNRSCGL